MMRKSQLRLLDRIASDVPAIEIEPGIVRFVGILNAKGLATEMSCEGHRDGRNAWVELDPAVFRGYLSRHRARLERFLIEGVGKWVLRVTFLGVRTFRGAGRIGLRRDEIEGVTKVDMQPTIELRCPARRGKTKTKWMKEMEKAAEQWL
jgi:hypothetical protein